MDILQEQNQGATHRCRCWARFILSLFKCKVSLSSSNPRFHRKEWGLWASEAQEEALLSLRALQNVSWGRLFTGGWCELAMEAGMRFLAVPASFS